MTIPYTSVTVELPNIAVDQYGSGTTTTAVPARHYESDYAHCQAARRCQGELGSFKHLSDDVCGC